MRELVLGGGVVVGLAGLLGLGWWLGLGEDASRMITRRTKLSPNFRAGELVVSSMADELGLDNWPSHEGYWKRLRALCTDVLEPIRALHGGPLRVNSAYRTPEVNRAVGGVSNSYHMRGLAADFEPIHGSAEALFNRIRREGLLERLPIDQLLYYPSRGHIHVGMRTKNPRREAGLSREGESVQWLS